MLLKKISNLFFTLAMIIAVLLFLDILPAFIDKDISIFSVVLLGIIASVINLLTVRYSKHNIIYSVVFWLSSLLIILGLGQLLLWPGVHYIFIAGMVLMFISFFIPKTEKNQKDNDLLDNL